MSGYFSPGDVWLVALEKRNWWHAIIQLVVCCNSAELKKLFSAKHQRILLARNFHSSLFSYRFTGFLGNAKNYVMNKSRHYWKSVELCPGNLAGSFTLGT